jgi:hypothetical protein
MYNSERRGLMVICGLPLEQVGKSRDVRKIKGRQHTQTRMGAATPDFKGNTYGQ